MPAHQTNPIILTGDRITGPLHLGHYIGSLQQRVLLQHSSTQYVLMADLQGLTDNGSHPEKVNRYLYDVVADYLAVGIDPARSVICLQSALPALAELTLLYLNLVTVSRLERNPTVKHEIIQKQFTRTAPAGFLIYPVSQAADISAFKAELVPVGEDQLPMIEQTNEIVSKVNSITGEPLLVHCRAQVGKAGRLPGIDGNGKMSKSLGNVINLSVSEDELTRAVNAMFTDPQHLRVSDPGRIEGNVVFTYLDAFHPDTVLISEMKAQYQTGGLGDRQCKTVLNDCLQSLLAPVREERARLMADKPYLLSVIRSGTEKAREVTQQTLDQVKRGMGLFVI